MDIVLVQHETQLAQHVVCSSYAMEEPLAGVGELKVFIMRLRRKLGDAVIRTMRSVGYVMELSP